MKIQLLVLSALMFFFMNCSIEKNNKRNPLPASDAEKVKQFELQLNNSADKGLVYISIGDIYFKNKLFNEAFDYYEKSIKLLNHKIHGYNKIISVYIEKRDYTGLEEYIVKLYPNKNNIDYMGIFLKLSDIYFKKRELKKNIQLIEELIKYFPGNPDLTERLILNYLEAGEYYHSDNMISSILKKNPDDIMGNYFLAKYKFLIKKTEDAKKIYQKILEKNVENNKFSAMTHKDMGLICLNENMFENAVNYFDQSIKYFTDDSELFYLKGLCYFNLFNFIMSLENLNKSVELDSSNHNARFLLVKVLIKHLKLYKEAIYNLNELLVLFPENLEYLKLKGDCLFIIENYSEAIETYKRIVELDPVSVQSEEAFLALGTINKKIDNKPAALREYLAGSKSFPENWQFYFNAANIYDDLGQLDESAEYFLKSIQLNPEAGIIYINLGNVYFKQKLYEKAASCYEYALKLGKNPDAAYNLSIVENILKSKH